MKHYVRNITPTYFPPERTMTYRNHPHRSVLAIAAIFAGIAACGIGRTEAGEFVLVRDGKPASTIVTATAATDAAAFAAQELQYHVQKITGATLPIKSDADKVEGARILVGPSAATAQLGENPSQFKDQEYLIRFVDNALILLGKDRASRNNVGAAKNWFTSDGVRLPPPPMCDDQATSYAVHDFLERFCSVRWFGPGELEMVLPKTATLAVQSKDIRRAPACAYRQPWGPMEIITNQWNKPSRQDTDLFWSRLRAGGEKFQCNHSFEGYYDRFWQRSSKRPEVFETSHPDWFGQGYSDEVLKKFGGQPPQMCYSNQDFIDQVVKDARAFFDGRGLAYCSTAAGEYFGLAPMDDRYWCRCPVCKAQFDPKLECPDPHHGKGPFSNGYASHYWFTFVNKVAREIAKTHPGKYVATLAYADFAYYPHQVRLESNVAVQMCLQIRNWWAPWTADNDRRFYRDWVSNEKGRRLYVWLYYCFPELLCGPWHCFPGFSAHTLDSQLKTYARDGIRGAFLNNTGEQVDLYITLKLWDDPSLDINALLEDFFTRYYGAAALPMKQFYLRVENIYSTTANYPEEVRKNRTKQFHQNEEIAWKYLGTEARMAELGKLMDEATRLASTDVEKQRVAIFRKAVWEYMVEGRKMYLTKQPTK